MEERDTCIHRILTGLSIGIELDIDIDTDHKT